MEGDRNTSIIRLNVKQNVTSSYFYKTTHLFIIGDGVKTKGYKANEKFKK